MRGHGQGLAQHQAQAAAHGRGQRQPVLGLWPKARAIEADDQLHHAVQPSPVQALLGLKHVPQGGTGLAGLTLLE
ncbi:MAG: hypothetical protein EBT33_22245 [Betaproteobacteria bacterium]|nr:hypothetical protein [Betaproteobacteria bacterium]